MKKVLRGIMLRLMLYANMLMVAGLLITGYSSVINPAHHPYLSLIGFAFPAFFYGNVAFMVVWLLVRFRYVLLPVAGFLLAALPVRTYCPLNLSADEDTDSTMLKVLSYNILGFNVEEAPKDEPNPILKYLVDSDADIICLQEYWAINSQDSLMTLFKEKYQYRDTIHSDGFQKGSDVVAICSRFPIIHKEHIPIYTKGNSLGVFDLNVNGDTVHVINAHLETVGMSYEQKDRFSLMMHGKTGSQDMKNDSKMIVSKLAASAALRAPQADAIGQYIAKHKGQRIIFCGDINDHPLSYVHHTIAKDLTDCYPRVGLWPGYSFQYHSMYVRIDNIMCSEHYEPVSCNIDKSIDLSDHFPIWCYLKAQNGEE